MRNSLAIMLLAGACCLVFSQEAKADVNVITDVAYYEPTNSIFAWAEVIPDYDTLAYYCFDDWGYVRKDDEVVHSFWGGSCDGQSYSEGFFPYDPDADYTVEVYPQLIVKHWIPSPGDGYDDYYNYIEWTYGDPVYFPYAFGFSGPGPEVSINASNIVLGGIYSLFTEGALAGPPHHVKVVSDSGQDLHDLCQAFPVREMVLQVVDVSGRRASLGKLPIRERFYDTTQGNPEIASVNSSCTNTSVIPSPCALRELGGKFKDTMKPGCNANSQRPCGLPELFVSWIWCPRGRNATPLAWTRRNISSEEILVNGMPRYNPGEELR